MNYIAVKGGKTPAIHYILAIKCFLDYYFAGKPASLYDKTNCDWAPTVNLGRDKFKPSFGATSSSRCDSTVDRGANKARLDMANTPLSMQSFLVEDLHKIETPTADDDSGSKECQCQTDISGHALRGMEEEMKRLTLENSSLKVQLASAQLTESSLAGYDNKVKFLTGLPTHNIGSSSSCSTLCHSAN